jgi:hypothetical protein
MVLDIASWSTGSLAPGGIGPCGYPSFSRNGQWIAFTDTDKMIYVVPATGGSFFPIATDANGWDLMLGISWSSDSQRIVYPYVSRSGGQGVAQTNLAGDSVQLTSPIWEFVATPSFQPKFVSSANVQIQSATYDYKAHHLAVVATSTLRQNDSLIVIGYGPMTWKPPQWNLDATNAPPPPGLIVCGKDGCVVQE